MPILRMIFPLSESGHEQDEKYSPESVEMPHGFAEGSALLFSATLSAPSSRIDPSRKCWSLEFCLHFLPALLARNRHGRVRIFV